MDACREKSDPCNGSGMRSSLADDDIIRTFCIDWGGRPCRQSKLSTYLTLAVQIFADVIE